MTNPSLEIIREKIIKTDAVIHLVSEKNDKIKRLENKLRTVLKKYVAKSKQIQFLNTEIHTCKILHEPLQEQCKNLEADYLALQIKYDTLVNSSQIKYQTVCKELEALKKKYERVNITLSATKCKKTSQTSQKKDIDSLTKKNEILKSQVIKLSEKFDINENELTFLRAKLIEKDEQNYVEEIENLKLKNDEKIEQMQQKFITETDRLSQEIHKLQLVEINLNNQLDGANKQNELLNDQLRCLISEKYHLECLLQNNSVLEDNLLDNELMDNSNENLKQTKNDMDDIDVDNMLSEMIDLPSVMSPFHMSCYGDIRDTFEGSTQDKVRKGCIDGSNIEDIIHCISEIPTNEQDLDNTKHNNKSDNIAVPEITVTPPTPPVIELECNFDYSPPVASTSSNKLNSDVEQMPPANQCEVIEKDASSVLNETIGANAEFKVTLPGEDLIKLGEDTEKRNIPIKMPNKKIKKRKFWSNKINTLKKELYVSVIKYVNRKFNFVSNSLQDKDKRKINSLCKSRRLRMMRWKLMKEINTYSTDTDSDICRQSRLRTKRARFKSAVRTKQHVENPDQDTTCDVLKKLTENENEYEKIMKNYKELEIFYNDLNLCSSVDVSETNKNAETIDIKESDDNQCVNSVEDKNLECELSSVDSGYFKSDSETFEVSMSHVDRTNDKSNCTKEKAQLDKIPQASCLEFPNKSGEETYSNIQDNTDINIPDPKSDELNQLSGQQSVVTNNIFEDENTDFQLFSSDCSLLSIGDLNVTEVLNSCNVNLDDIDMYMETNDLLNADKSLCFDYDTKSDKRKASSDVDDVDSTLDPKYVNLRTYKRRRVAHNSKNSKSIPHETNNTPTRIQNQDVKVKTNQLLKKKQMNSTNKQPLKKPLVTDIETSSVESSLENKPGEEKQINSTKNQSLKKPLVTDIETSSVESSLENKPGEEKQIKSTKNQPLKKPLITEIETSSIKSSLKNKLTEEKQMNSTKNKPLKNNSISIPHETNNTPTRIQNQDVKVKTNQLLKKKQMNSTNKQPLKKPLVTGIETSSVESCLENKPGQEKQINSTKNQPLKKPLLTEIDTSSVKSSLEHKLGEEKLPTLECKTMHVQKSNTFKKPNCKRTKKSTQHNLSTINPTVSNCWRDSPKSPEHNVDINLSTTPKIIPLNPPKRMFPATAQSLFKKLVCFPNQPSVVDELADSCAHQNMDHFARLIISEVSGDIVHKADMKYTPPAPILTEIQRILLGFMFKLNGKQLPGLMDSFMREAEKFLLFKSDLGCLQPVTRLYTAVCKFKKDTVRMRRMICDALYFMDDLVVPFLFTTLSTWIDLLPLEINSNGDPLIKVLIQVVNLKTCNKPGYNLLCFRKLLHDYYGYPMERSDSNNIFKELFEQYLRTPVKTIEYSLLILCKNHPTKWVFQQIESHIKPVLKSTLDDRVKKSAVILVGYISKQFNMTDDAVVLGNITIWLNLLCDDVLPFEVKECIRETVKMIPKNV